jgi:hypothetical protein
VGDDDIERFDTWLAGLLRWYRVYNVTGDQKDAMRVDLCGTTLTGLAATWYADEVEAWNRQTNTWLGFVMGTGIPAVIGSWVPWVRVRFWYLAHRGIPCTRTTVSRVSTGILKRSEHNFFLL